MATVGGYQPIITHVRLETIYIDIEKSISIIDPNFHIDLYRWFTTTLQTANTHLCFPKKISSTMPVTSMSKLALLSNPSCCHYWSCHEEPEKKGTATGKVLFCFSFSDLTLDLLNLFRGNINIYLHFISLLHTDMTQVLKILPQVRPGPTYSIESISWLPMSWRRKEPGHQ